MKKVYLVIQQYSEDYHGTYESVMCVCVTEELARTKVSEFGEKAPSCDYEYHFDVWNVES